MPPAAKKDCTVILFDVNAKDKQKALQTLLKITCLNYFTGSKDLMKLILFNSSTTSNRFSDDDNACYSHIYEVTENVELFSPNSVLAHIEANPETGNANWLEALRVAAASLIEDFAEINGIVTLQLLFITDLSIELHGNNDKLVQQIIGDLNREEIYLYVVGPDVKCPFTIKSAEDVQRWMKDAVFASDNLKVVKKIIDGIERGVVCGYSVGIHLFSTFKNSGGSQPWNVSLTIGSKIEIAAQTMKLLYLGMECKLKADKESNRQVIWIDAEDESIEIPPEDVIHGIKRHGKFIQMPDNKMFKIQNTRGFTVLCFTASSDVPEYIMQGEECHTVLPLEDDNSVEVMSLLVDCLAAQRKYIVARRIYAKDALPKIVVLVPQPRHKPKCFLMAHLPYADDIKCDYVEQDVSLAPRCEVDEDIKNFLDSIDIDGDKCKKNIPLAPLMMRNINTDKLINKAADKLLGKSLNLGEIDIDYAHSSGSGESKLKSVWPERKAEVEKSAAADSDAESEIDWWA